MDKTTIGLKTVFERLMFYCCMAMLIVGPLVGGACAAGQHTETVHVVANSGALTISNAETTALLIYEEEQLQAIAKVKADGGTKEDAERAVAIVREKWKPHWELFREAEQAHAALVTAVEAYETGRAIIVNGEERVPTLTDIAVLSTSATKLYDQLAELFNKKKKIP